MKIKNSDILELNAALRSVDTCKFTSAICLALVRNLRLVKAVSEDLLAVRQKLGGDVPIQPNSVEERIFLKSWLELMSQETDIDLVSISEGDLDLEKNSIPVTVLVGLTPILTS